MKRQSDRSNSNELQRVPFNPLGRRFVCLILCAALAVAAGCNLRGDSRYSARKKLAEIGIPYTKSAFLQRVYEGDSLATSLFFEAGMNPNSEADFGRYLLQPDPEVQRWMNGLNGKPEVWNRLVYGNSGSMPLQGVNYRPVMLPISLVARIKAQNNSPDYREIADMFTRQGVSNEVSQIREERLKNDLHSAENDLAKQDAVVPKDDKFFNDINKEVERRVGKSN